MFFMKLAAFVMIFALPLGIVIGLAARQAKLGNMTRFPNHYSNSLRNFGIKIAIGLIATAIISYKHGSRFDPVSAGLLAMLITFTGLIGFLAYYLLVRGRRLG